MLSDAQIVHFASELKLRDFRGCFMKDELKSTRRLPGAYVVNMQNSVESGHFNQGSHWCGLYIDHDHKACWMDSFGFPPPLEVIAFSGKPAYSTKCIQSLRSNAAGTTPFSFFST